MSEKNTILVINPGSTSTKVAIYKNITEFSSRVLQHHTEQIIQYASVYDQLDMRKQAICDYLNEIGVSVQSISAIAARGGIIGELQCGAYVVNDKLIEASKNSLVPHASNLAAIIGYEIAKPYDIPTYIYDAICGCGKPDEVFRLSGMPEISREFFTHLLNGRAVCIAQAEKDNKKLEDMTYLVAHMGGGVSVTVLKGGRVIDLVSDDEGAFTAERAGKVPCRSLVKMCFSGTYTYKEIYEKLRGKGGMIAYLGTADLQEVEQLIAGGDKKAKLVLEAMVMQTAKDIGSLATVVDGKIEKIILTGGMAYSTRLIGMLKKKVEFIAPVEVMPGSFEMEALAKGIFRVLEGKETARTL